MSISPEITLGPFSQRMCSGAKWLGQDDFPSNQTWANELERVLSHLETHGQLQRYLSNLRGTLTQRHGFLAEARVAFFLCYNGFSITSWEPQGSSNSLGEFEIQWNSSLPIFVEVKGPTWEGELNESELKNGRKKTGKYKDGEPRILNTMGKIIKAIDKSKEQNKFAEGRPNLLVVYASYLFASPLALNRKIVEPKIKTALCDLPNLGGVLVFDATCKGPKIDYETLFIENEAKYCRGKLPELVVEHFNALSTDLAKRSHVRQIDSTAFCIRV